MSSKRYVTNEHSETLYLHEAGGGVRAIPPGETEHFALADPESGHVLGVVHAGLCVVSETAPGKAARAESAQRAADAGRNPPMEPGAGDPPPT